ncbi:hypothetical protein AB9P05_01410 [Roseivirga sp. BDSF3-8]|uniref:hypothetical protein n=1 Tax=Roseivirga sp. BDSF3-8 TaxID=3241598 RepID=UPI003531CF74
MPVNDSPSLEHEADVAGAKAASGQQVGQAKMAEPSRAENTAVQKKVAQKQDAETESAPTTLQIFPDAETKRRYLDNTKHRITQAYANFSDAVSELKAEIMDAAKEVPSVASILVEVSMGFLMPGVGRAISSLADRIPNNASNTAFRLAIAAQNERITSPILGGAGAAAKKALEAFLVSGAVREANDLTQFADAFREQQGVAYQALKESMTMDSPDEMILTNYVVFDAHFATVGRFKNQIQGVLDNYKKYVLAIRKRDECTIGNDRYHSVRTGHRLTYLPDSNGRRRLALVRVLINSTMFSTRQMYSFDSFVPEEMQSMALTEARRMGRFISLSPDEVSMN